MTTSKQDITTSKSPVEDQGEPISLVEPLCIAVDSRFREGLNDLAVDLAAAII